MRRKKVCLVGYGSTEYSRKSEESQLGHYATAIRAVLNQTGLKKKDIHGLSITTQASPDTAPHVAEQLGFGLDFERRLRRRGWRRRGASGGRCHRVRVSGRRALSRRQFLRSQRRASTSS